MPTPSVFTSVINQYLPEPHASLVNGILFGVSLKTTKIFFLQLKKVGLLHIVVLSGMNIAILATIISSLTNSFSRKIAALITILITIIFIMFVRPQAPIVRAGIMGLLTAVSLTYGRRKHGLYFLLIAAVLMGFFWPRWLKTISFQLSFGATLGIMLFAQVKNQSAEPWFNQLKGYIRENLRTSLAAQIFTAPLIFFYFKEVSLMAPFANLLVSFLIGPLMVMGLLTAVLGKIHLYLGLLPSYFVYGMTNYMVFSVETLSTIPFGYFKF